GYRAVNPREDVEALARRLRSAGSFALRVLPDQPSAMRAAIVGLAFSTEPRDADYVPIGHRALGAVESVPVQVALDALRGVLEDPAIEKVGHDLKYDAIILARHGVTLRGLELDTMIACYLIDATRSEHKFEELALEYTSYKAIADEDVCGRGAKAVSLAEVPAEAAVDYASERADLAGQLVPFLREQLATDGLTSVYETLELPLIPVLMAVERAGIRIDGPLLASQSQKLE